MYVFVQAVTAKALGLLKVKELLVIRWTSLSVVSHQVLWPSVLSHVA